MDGAAGMIDFAKHTTGDVVTDHCCDSCARAACIEPKTPAGSGVASWLCAACGHHGIGSSMDFLIGNWLIARPLRYPILSATSCIDGR